jgi:photosystem II stability/assembly factor-like uncharacterized protein
LSRARFAPLLFSLGALSLSFASTARANGRFPRAERLVEDPRDPNSLILAATYGLVTTTDHGASWYHICEQAFAADDSYVGDPLVDFAASGSLLVDVQTTLNVSRDRGCSWSTALGGPTENLPDFTVTRSTPGSILALRTVLEDASVVVHLVESTDDGATFATVGGALPVFSAFTVDVAPSDPNTIYVSGRSASGLGQLLVSTDHGMSFTSNALPANTTFDETPYIAAVHPDDPKKIFVRTDAWNSQSGTYLAGDALLYTDDAGKTWTELYRATAKLLGFALSPDASTVLLGYGGTHDPDRPVDDSVTGIYESSTLAFAFTRIVKATITCLSWTRVGVYVCASQAEKGYALGFSRDANFGDGGSNLQPLLDLSKIVGPMCCGGATQAVCTASWPANCGLFGACGQAGNPPTCSSDEGVEAGAGAEELPEAGADEGGAKGRSGGGCGCRAYGSSRGPGCASLSGLLIVLALRFRRYGHDHAK